jgi:hypothetical protein
MPGPWEFKEKVDFVTANFCLRALAWGSQKDRRADHHFGQGGGRRRSNCFGNCIRKGEISHFCFSKLTSHWNPLPHPAALNFP